MVKKLFPFFLAFIVLIIIFSYYHENNPVIKKILDSRSIKTIEPEIITDQQTDKEQKADGETEKIFLQVDEPENNIAVSVQEINVSGMTISKAYVFINEQELKADINGKFSTTVILEEGENYILVVASDELGNSAEKEIVVNLESTK